MTAQEVFPGVTVNPLVSGGNPCIKGTGIITAVIALRFRAGEAPGEIARDYKLSLSQIHDVLRWETLDRDARRRRIRKALAALEKELEQTA
jgi:uncharacterized protein (DUF433 family)